MLGMMITVAQAAMMFFCYLVLLIITAFCAGKALPKRPVVAVVVAIIAADLIEYCAFHKIGFRYAFAVTTFPIDWIVTTLNAGFGIDIEECCIAFVVGLPLVAAAYAAVRVSSVVRLRLPRYGMREKEKGTSEQERGAELDARENRGQSNGDASSFRKPPD